MQLDSIFNKEISLYYNSNPLHKPYCEIGMAPLPTTNNYTADDYN